MVRQIFPSDLEEEVRRTLEDIDLPQDLATLQDVERRAIAAMRRCSYREELLLRLQVAVGNELRGVEHVKAISMASKSYERAARAAYKINGNKPSDLNIDLWERTIACATEFGETEESGKLDAAHASVKMGEALLNLGRTKEGLRTIDAGVEKLKGLDKQPEKILYIRRLLAYARHFRQKQ